MIQCLLYMGPTWTEVPIKSLLSVSYAPLVDKLNIFLRSSLLVSPGFFHKVLFQDVSEPKTNNFFFYINIYNKTKLLHNLKNKRKANINYIKLLPTFTSVKYTCSRMLHIESMLNSYHTLSLKSRFSKILWD